MRRLLRARLLASAFAVVGLGPIAAVSPVCAQYDDSVSFDYFHDVLQHYGYWLYSDRWGLVWQPQYVPGFFRPYDSDGHWVYTDAFGWYWQSDVPWGDIAYHYGRWVDDPDDGWLWIPGYTWSPAWVVWRTNGQYVGWMPAPPDERFLSGEGDVSFGLSFGGAGLSFSWNGEPDYGYRTWYGPDFDERWYAQNWVIIGVGHLADPGFHAYAVRDPARVIDIIHDTRNITNYTVVNNYVVNKGVAIDVVQRAAGHRIAITSGRAVIRNPRLVLSVNASRQIQLRERSFTPRGRGFANSAPPPPARVVDRLSANLPARKQGQPSHLFTRATVTNPQIVQSHFHGPAPGGMEHGAPAGMENPHTLGGTGRTTGTEVSHSPEQGPPGSSGPEQTLRPGGEMSGPQGAPTEAPHHHQEQAPSAGSPGEMGGPSGGMSHPMEQPSQTGSPSGEMSGPPAASGETHHHHEQAAPGGPPSQMSVPPSAPAYSPPPGEINHHEEKAPASAPPKSSSPPPPPTEQGKPEKKKPEKEQQPPP